jgi:hypothetical protein
VPQPNPALLTRRTGKVTLDYVVLCTDCCKRQYNSPARASRRPRAWEITGSAAALYPVCHMYGRMQHLLCLNGNSLQREQRKRYNCAASTSFPDCPRQSRTTSSPVRSPKQSLQPQQKGNAAHAQCALHTITAETKPRAVDASWRRDRKQANKQRASLCCRFQPTHKPQAHCGVRYYAVTCCAYFRPNVNTTHAHTHTRMAVDRSV